MAFKGSTISSGTNAKTVKGDGSKYETAIMYLAPADASGVGNVCAMAVIAGCKIPCLFTAGRGQMNSVETARINKTKRYFANRIQFMADLSRDCEKFVAYCKRKGVQPLVRLNGTSDIGWEVGHEVIRIGKKAQATYANIFEAFPEINFYDYTKIIKRAYRDLPDNYKLVLSYSNANRDYAKSVIAAAEATNANVAIVYRTKEIRDTAMQFKAVFGKKTNRTVIDGDEDDLRFYDPDGCIVGLYAKGKAKHDTSGFVVG